MDLHRKTFECSRLDRRNRTLTVRSGLGSIGNMGINTRMGHRNIDLQHNYQSSLFTRWRLPRCRSHGKYQYVAPALLSVPFVLLFSSSCRIALHFSALFAVMTSSRFFTRMIQDASAWETASPAGLAPLYSATTPPAACTTRWVMSNLDLPEITSGHEYTTSDLYSTDYWRSCNPASSEVPKYSPGMCAPSQTFARLEGFRYKNSALWHGICCNRYLTLTGCDHFVQLTRTLAI
jgi:hypothetical protein